MYASLLCDTLGLGPGLRMYCFSDANEVISVLVGPGFSSATLQWPVPFSGMISWNCIFEAFPSLGQSDLVVVMGRNKNRFKSPRIRLLVAGKMGLPHDFLGTGFRIINLNPHLTITFHFAWLSNSPNLFFKSNLWLHHVTSLCFLCFSHDKFGGETHVVHFGWTC